MVSNLKQPLLSSKRATARNPCAATGGMYRCNQNLETLNIIIAWRKKAKMQYFHNYKLVIYKF